MVVSCDFNFHKNTFFSDDTAASDIFFSHFSFLHQEAFGEAFSVTDEEDEALSLYLELWMVTRLKMEEEEIGFCRPTNSC